MIALEWSVMLPKYKRNFKHYQDLWAHEWRAIHLFMGDNDTTELVALIQQSELSPAMREVIADMVTGKLKRKPRKKPSTAYRDMFIVMEIAQLIFEGHRLTSNRESNGAAIVAEKYGISEECALKVYSLGNERLKN